MLLGVLSLSAKDFGRIDLDGFKNRIPLTPLASNGVGMLRNPQKARTDYALEVRMWGNEHIVWQTSVIRFRPEKSGVITLALLANWVSKENLEKLYHGHWPRTVYRSVVPLKGCRIVNPDFTDMENGKIKGWKIPQGADYRQIDVEGRNTPVVIGRCYAPVTQEIEVKSGMEIELKIVWALESTLFPRQETGHNKDIYTSLAERIITEKKHAVHPQVLFGKADLELLREKVKSPFWAQYRKDLVVEADFYLKKYSDDYVFQFTENPTAQLVTETLLSAWLFSGKTEYAKKAIRLGMNFCNTYFLKKKVRTTGKFRDYLGLDTNAIRPFVLTYDVLFDEMNDSEKVAFLKMIAYMGDLCQRMTENQPEFENSSHKNFLMGQMGAFALLALSVKGELSQAEKWCETALYYLRKFSKEALKKDGMFPEGTTYFNYTGENLLLAYAAMREDGKVFYREGNLPQTVKWQIWSLLPWKNEFDNFSDGHHTLTSRAIPALFQYFDETYGALLAAWCYGKCPRFTSNNAWAWLYLKEPKQEKLSEIQKNLGTAMNLPFGGMSVFCDGWSNDAAKVFFYATSYHYAAHSQADRGHFNFYSDGYNWAGDSGYGNDGKAENSATSWEAHSQVLIDGKGQSFLPKTRVSGTFSRILDYCNSTFIGYSAADLKSAYDYGVWYTRKGGVHPNIPVQKAVRHLLFMRGTENLPTYLLIYDDIRKDQAEHMYDWQMQVEPTNVLEVNTNGAEVRPLKFEGTVMDIQGTGDWNNPQADGYNIWGYPENGRLRFEFDVPREGNFYLWSLAAGYPYMSGCDMTATLNGVSFPGNRRIKFSPEYARPVWSRYTLNKGYMGTPEPLTLKRGRNTLELKSLVGLAQIKKLIFVPSAQTMPDDLENGRLPSGSIVVDSRNLVDWKSGRVINSLKRKNVVCRITALYPKKVEYHKDYFQPTRTPLHPRLKIRVNAVEPEFLIMLQPYHANGEQPQIVRNSGNGVKSVRIDWKSGSDSLALNPKGQTFRLNGLETDARLLVVRNLRDNDEVLAVKASFLKKDGKVLYDSKCKTLLITGKQLNISDFTPISMPTDSL